MRPTSMTEGQVCAYFSCREKDLRSFTFMSCVLVESTGGNVDDNPYRQDICKKAAAV